MAKNQWIVLTKGQYDFVTTTLVWDAKAWMDAVEIAKRKMTLEEIECISEIRVVCVDDMKIIDDAIVQQIKEV